MAADGRWDARDDPVVGVIVFPLNSDRGFRWTGELWDPIPGWGEMPELEPFDDGWVPVTCR